MNDTVTAQEDMIPHTYAKFVYTTTKKKEEGGREKEQLSRG